MGAYSVKSAACGYPSHNRADHRYCHGMTKFARRIEAWLGPERGGRAEIWLEMQKDYDLRVTAQKTAPQVMRAPEFLAT